MANKLGYHWETTDAGNGSNGICRVIGACRSPSPDPGRSAKEMKLRVIVILVFGAMTSLSCGGDAPPKKPLQMNVAEVYDFVVSLMELRESSQHKRFDADELKTIATALAASKFLKKMEHEDIARTPYISRYQFTHGFLGGTPRTGENESGMLTIDCRRFYWGHAIFEIDANNAAKLQKLFPTPKNALTKSELPNIRPEDKQAEPSKIALSGFAPRSY